VAGKGLTNYETSFEEKLSFWMICLGNPVLNTTLSIQAAYLRDWTESVSEDEEEGLSRGGIAGIVIACVVAFLFIVGLLFSLKGTLWFKNKCSCCKNRIISPREATNAEQKENEPIATGNAGSSNDIKHQPEHRVDYQPHNKASDLTRQPANGGNENEGLINGGPGELNSTGQNLLSIEKKSHEQAKDSQNST